MELLSVGVEARNKFAPFQSTPIGILEKYVGVDHGTFPPSHGKPNGKLQSFWPKAYGGCISGTLIALYMVII